MIASPQAERVRLEIEGALARRIPSALTPRPRTIHERAPSGVPELDTLFDGGIPVGAITEFVGVTGSGRTTAALTFAAAIARAERVVAWIDVADAFDPMSAEVNGLDLSRLLWVRCPQSASAARETAAPTPLPPSVGVAQPRSPLPVRGGGSPHPRNETNGMPEAISEMLEAHGGLHDHQSRRERKRLGTPGMPNIPLGKVLDREEQRPTDRQPSRRERAISAVETRERKVDMQAMEAAQGGRRCAEPVAHRRKNPETAQRKQDATHTAAQNSVLALPHPSAQGFRPRGPKRSWSALDHALRATDLLLQAGGFGLIVLDLGDTPAEMSWRIPLATWFRYRAACERSRASLLLLTRHPCARSSAELVVRMGQAHMEAEGNVLTGLRFHAEIERQRFQQAPQSNVVAFRKPPQRAETAVPRGTWRGRASWAI